MKPITQKEAKEFDREAFYKGIEKNQIDKAIGWFNRKLKLIYPKLSADEWYNHCPTRPIPEFADRVKELKKIYNEVGFDFEWQPPYVHFKIKLLNENSNS